METLCCPDWSILRVHARSCPRFPHATHTREQTIEDRRDELWLEHGMSWDDAVHQAVEEHEQRPND